MTTTQIRRAVTGPDPVLLVECASDEDAAALAARLKPPAGVVLYPRRAGVERLDGVVVGRRSAGVMGRRRAASPDPGGS